MDHSKSIYAIQGLFYQDPSGTNLLQSKLFVKKNLTHTLFSGIIAPSPDDTDGNLFGVLQDHWGVSNLTEIEFSEKTLNFIKQYETRNDKIRYSFETKIGNVWIGTYHGNMVGHGFAKCLITTLDQNFFDPTPAAQLLGSDLK